MIAIPSSVIRHFMVAGWHPGRTSDVPYCYPEDHPATQILREFGGLRVGQQGAGVECAQTHIDFKQLRKPDDEVLKLEQALQTELLGIGGDSYIDLYVDTKGHLFAYEDVSGDIYLAGRSFAEAMERMLLGLRLTPLLLPDQSSVGFYGEDLHLGDARLFSLADLEPTG